MTNAKTSPADTQRERVEVMKARPKADLHCHALLSAPRAAYQALGSQVASQAHHYGSWDAFDLAIGRDFISVIRSPDDFRHVISAAYAHMVGDGIVYAEPSFDLALPHLLGCDVDTLLQVIVDCGHAYAHKLQLRPYFGLIRTLPLSGQMRYANAFADSGLFFGVDIYGDETAGEHRDFKALFDLASARGLRKKAHAGEFDGPSGIEDAIHTFDLDQLQHGVRAIESDATLRLIADRAIELNVCVESNLSLAVATDRATHPIAELHRRGIVVTVNSDDYALFGTSVSEDLALLEACGLKPSDVDSIIANGLKRHQPGS